MGSRYSKQTAYFYPRSPCGERPIVPRTIANKIVFLSTLSLRRATMPLAMQIYNHYRFLSTLSLRRATTVEDAQQAATGISIHALLAESDGQHRQADHCRMGFLSTLSLRRATTSFCRLLTTFFDFYPRSPCGERLTAVLAV